MSSQLAAFEASIDAAQAAADSASAAAASAQGTADSASASASNAQNAANNAQGTATSAQNTANTAQDAANSAQSAATVNANTIATLESQHRFFACSDGVTVADTATGLLWERKTVTGDVHDVDTAYTWSSTGTAADGTAYTVFLADLNTSPGFAGHTDWRLPIISELQSILTGLDVEAGISASPPDPASGQNVTGQATTCVGSPCIDPDFAAIGGPTASSFYWSASSDANSPNSARGADFFDGSVPAGNNKTDDFFVRAVRAGSCSS